MAGRGVVPTLEGVEPAEIEQSYIVRDLRGPWQEFGVCSHSSGLTVKLRVALVGYPGCVLHKGAN